MDIGDSASRQAISAEGLAALVAKVEAYRFERPGEAVTFIDRLRKETGWSRSFAEKAVAEYRRFAVLAAASGHRVSPSPVIDEVWHLHLTDTRRYWHDFCGEVLGRPLHHDPSRGGDEEAVALAEQYLMTLAAYEAAFGPPPADIWPRPSPRRLRAAVRIAKAWLSRAAGVAAGPALLLSGCAALYDSASPGAVQGPQFILGYVAALAVALLVLALVQSRIAEGHASSVRATELGAYELAYLTGGAQRAVATAILRLQQRGRVVAEKDRLHPQGLPDSSDAPLERAVLGAISGGKLKQVSVVSAAVKALRERLEGAGLLPDARMRGQAWLAALILIGPLLALGGLRLWFGYQHGRSVGFLIIAMIFAVPLALIVTGTSMQITRAGREARRRARASTPRGRSASAEDAMLPIAFALWGAAALPAFGAFDPQRHLGAFASSGDGGGGGGCGGGGCGGGCGG